MAKRRHTPGTLPYYRVSGERKETIMGEDDKPLGTRIVEARVRFESLSLDAAQQFATAVFRSENLIMEIHEMTR